MREDLIPGLIEVLAVNNMMILIQPVVEYFPVDCVQLDYTITGIT